MNMSAKPAKDTTLCISLEVWYGIVLDDTYKLQRRWAAVYYIAIIIIIFAKKKRPLQGCGGRRCSLLVVVVEGMLGKKALNRCFPPSSEVIPL